MPRAASLRRAAAPPPTRRNVHGTHPPPLSPRAAGTAASHAAKCGWPGHCLGDRCTTDDDCDGNLVCTNRACSNPKPTPQPGAGTQGRGVGRPLAPLHGFPLTARPPVGRTRTCRPARCRTRPRPCAQGAGARPAGRRPSGRCTSRGRGRAARSASSTADASGPASLTTSTPARQSRATRRRSGWTAGPAMSPAGAAAPRWAVPRWAGQGWSFCGLGGVGYWGWPLLPLSPALHAARHRAARPKRPSLPPPLPRPQVPRFGRRALARGRHVRPRARAA
jgi:hypothetical protein